MSEFPTIGFDQFRQSWLEGVTEGTPSTVELGRRFALKLVTQWMDSSESTADFVLCDGAGDGGIDIALLDTGPDESNDEAEESGHSWYLVQSKYGSAFKGANTLLTEGQKVIDTLDGRRPQLNSLAEGLLVLLCINLFDEMFIWQHGQRGSFLAMARAIVVRSVAIEVATWRSGRIGSAAGSVAFG